VCINPKWIELVFNRATLC